MIFCEIICMVSLITWLPSLHTACAKGVQCVWFAVILSQSMLSPHLGGSQCSEPFSEEHDNLLVWHSISFRLFLCFNLVKGHWYPNFPAISAILQNSLAIFRLFFPAVFFWHFFLREPENWRCGDFWPFIERQEVGQKCFLDICLHFLTFFWHFWVVFFWSFLEISLI